ncbi:MAG: succinate--CoA ligase subunit alpha [Elusimicrobia bacterium]|nr:succinate--CoA ligase subunit alpha [Elusimicrobiota bacterium]
MSILIDKKTRVICQGITGGAGSFHSRLCKEYGTQMVGGVSPGKGGAALDDIPIFDTVRDCVEKTDADATMIFVPAPFAADAILEAAASGIKIIVCITEGIPVLDMVRVKEELKLFNSANKKDKIWLIGPNCPGLITPEECKIGIMPGYIHRRASQQKQVGRAGIISRSGTLTYEAVWQLTQLGIGQTTVIGIGGDPIPGTHYIELIEMFEKDAETDMILLIGEIGGSAEEDAALYFKEKMSKPVCAFIAGKTAPEGKRMGHAGAIIEGGSRGTAQEKITFLKTMGIQIAPSPAEIGITVQKVLQSR